VLLFYYKGHTILILDRPISLHRFHIRLALISINYPHITFITLSIVLFRRCIVLLIIGGSEDYLEWIDGELESRTIRHFQSKAILALRERKSKPV